MKNGNIKYKYRNREFLCRVSHIESANLADKIGLRDVFLFKNSLLMRNFRMKDKNVSSYVVLYCIKKTPNIAD